jgi:hypothetical protein
MKFPLTSSNYQTKKIISEFAIVEGKKELKKSHCCHFKGTVPRDFQLQVFS